MPRKPRRAKLNVAHSDEPGKVFLRLRARNSEILMSGELVTNGMRARVSAVRAMIDVLEDEGLVVLTHSELDELMRAAVEAEDRVRAELVVTKAEEAGR